MSTLDNLDLRIYAIPEMAFQLSVHSEEISAVVQASAKKSKEKQKKLAVNMSALILGALVLVDFLAKHTVIPAWLCAVVLGGAIWWAFKKFKRAIYDRNPSADIDRIKGTLSKYLYEPSDIRLLASLLCEEVKPNYQAEPWYVAARQQWQTEGEDDLIFSAIMLYHCPEALVNAKRHLYALHAKRTDMLKRDMAA
tara:strand:- start:6194 stop:6778 length:585 start_codon:yes stop_codon:yes gene_type:complete